LKYHYKVCVYAICKNEEQFVDRFVKSLSEADAIYVLDTGSTDNTVKKLKKHGVHVKEEKIEPWRFDVARNHSLDMVPNDADICVCLDLDECLIDGWREILENIWDSTTTLLHYNYNWSLDEKGKPLVNFYIGKIHSRHGYIWTHPVHEVLTRILPNEKIKVTDDITVNHYPDNTKSRGSYLPLLELSVKEDPLDDRNMHYLGREYMFYGRYQECIDTLIHHLGMTKATWRDERCASMRFIARSYENLNRIEEAKMWYQKAMVEAPYLREPFFEYAMLMYQLNQDKDAIKYFKKALKIVKNPKCYINDPRCYDGTIEDVLSICYYRAQKYNLAFTYVKKALALNPDNDRIKKNYELIKKERDKQKEEK